MLELRALSKDKLDAEKENRKAYQNMANTDSLTGVRNKYAYSEYERGLDQKIQSGEIQELAVGYSVLEAEDRQVRDVFERADKMMYVRKQELKAMGAKIRES